MSEAEVRTIFQRRFLELLQERRVTQLEVARVLGVSTSTVSTWAKGLNMPRMDTVERLANYYGLPKSYFIEADRPAQTAFTEFDYALHNETKDMTEMDKQILLSMAKQLKDARRQNGETGPAER